MTRALKKLIQEIILEEIEFRPLADVERGTRLAAEIAKAIENPRKYRREQRAEVARLRDAIDESWDGDEIIGHRD
jgi:hypothetical protein